MSKISHALLSHRRLTTFMRKALPSLLVMGLLLAGLTSPLRADESASSYPIDKMRISIWPEYDDPRVLVQYQGEFAKSNYPKKVEFLVPQEAAINATCAIRSNGQHTSETWQTKKLADGLSLVTYELSEPTFHVEFYYNPLEGSTDKTLPYNYKATYPVKSLTVEMQQPLKATNFTLNPTTDKVSSDKDGFKYYEYDFNNISVDGTISVTANYTKTNPNPSVSAKPSGGGSASSSGGDNTVSIIVVVIGALLLGAGAFWWINQQSRPRYAPRKASAPSVSRSSTKPVSTQRRVAGGFCTYCGAALETDDNFCPGCGQKARKK